MQNGDNHSGDSLQNQRKSSVQKAAEKLAAGAAIFAGGDVAPRGQPVALEVNPQSPPPVAAERDIKPAGKHENIDFEAMRRAGIVTDHGEGSLISEEFRLVKRPLLLKAFDHGPGAIRNGNLIMVSSANANEGKTFCAISLAMSIALERDLTVMLVDADLINPTIPETLGFEAELGLVDVLSDEKMDLADVLLRTDLDNLTILPAGRSHHLATELLASDRMERLVGEIAQRYSDRVIIFDSPPSLVSSIPAVLALHVGQTVFVVHADHSSQASVDAGLGLISACKNIYLLLNKARGIGDADGFGAYYGDNRK